MIDEDINLRKHQRAVIYTRQSTHGDTHVQHTEFFDWNAFLDVPRIYDSVVRCES